MEWVEVTAKTVDLAVKGALAELGLNSVDEASVEVIQEPDKGFLGFGGDKAIVRVKAAPKKRSRGRRGGGRGEGSKGDQRGGRQKQGDRQKQGGNRQNQGGNRQKQDGDGAKQGGDRQQRQGRKQDSGGGEGQQGRNSDKRRDRPASSENRGGAKPRDGRSRDNSGRERVSNRSEPSIESTKDADVSEQADILKSFMTGLVDAFGLEGTTTTRVEDDIIYVDVTGEQTEALVGAKGSILQAILDLMKIIVQRKTHHRARIRLDIAGYAERRREALNIYSQRLSEQVLADGEEVMLEPMHPGDRKVVHDAVADIEGVRSWSEGEEPQRSVIIGPVAGFEVVASGDEDEDDDDE